MLIKEQSKTWGGARKGAGKEKVLENPVNLQVVLEKKEREQFKKIYKGKASAMIREFIRKKIEESQENLA